VRIRPRTIRHQSVARLTALLAVPLLAVSLAACSQTPARQEATEACLEKLGPSPVGSGSSGSSGGPDAEEMRENLLDLAACLREQGYDVEDPAPGEGLGMPGGITEEALKECDMDVTSGVPAQ
jgi:hypothetical protein